MRVTKRQLRRIIKEEKARLLREIREPDWKQGYAGGAPARPGPMTNVATAPDADAIAQIAGAIKAGEYGEELAYEHPSARVFSDALLNFDDLYGPEAAAYMDSIEQALTSAGADSGEAEEFVTTLANA